MVDLELMYNFTTFTFATLSDDPSLRQMLKTTAVKMAMDNDCLMRMILAVSALHLAHYRPSRRVHYLQRGLEHHAAANRKAISLLTDLRQEDCEALHLFSVLTLFFALGCPREEQSSFILGESVVPNWLALVRGTEPIIQILDPNTYKGPLAPLFEYGRNAWRKLYGSEQPRNPALLMELQDQVSRACKDKEVLPIYLATIDHLRHILGMIIPSARIGGRLERRLSGWLSQNGCQRQAQPPGAETGAVGHIGGYVAHGGFPVAAASRKAGAGGPLHICTYADHIQKAREPVVAGGMGHTRNGAHLGAAGR
uniref:Transcription factor domain-containing protein n=1 Tax=Bionectria ochroleuca TaxID=29856 RepID=A0A8H7TTW9_BIOOC